MLLVGLLLTSCNNVGGPAEESVDSMVDEEIVEQESQEDRYSTIDAVRRNIDGTVWTYTEVGSKLWFKYVFHDGVVDYYCSFPAAGEWGEVSATYTYEVNEHRYTDTGRRYIAIDAKRDPSDEHWCLQLVPADGQASLGFGSPFKVEPHDYVWD